MLVLHVDSFKARTVFAPRSRAIKYPMVLNHALRINLVATLSTKQED